MAKRDTAPHTVIRYDDAGHVRTRIKVGDNVSAEVIAKKMRAADPSGRVEVKRSK